jgi:hypothetical protein
MSLIPSNLTWHADRLGREQRRRRWGAPRAMLLAGAPLARAAGAGTEARHCERRDGQQDGPNASGRAAREERAATSVRRVGGEAILRALATTRSVGRRRIECPKCRFGGGAFCWSRPVPHLAALRGGRGVCDKGS